MFPLLAVLPPVLLVFLIPPAASFCLPCHCWADCPPLNISSLIGLYESPNLLFLCVEQPFVPATYSSFDYMVTNYVQYVVISQKTVTFIGLCQW